jgi:hypothetical protein
MGESAEGPLRVRRKRRCAYCRTPTFLYVLVCRAVNGSSRECESHIT